VRQAQEIAFKTLRHLTGKRGGKGNWGEVSEGKKDLGKTPVGAGIPRGRIPRTYILLRYGVYGAMKGKS
jgi:hypothetical protein